MWVEVAFGAPVHVMSTAVVSRKSKAVFSSAAVHSITAVNCSCRRCGVIQAEVIDLLLAHEPHVYAHGQRTKVPT